MTGVVRTLFVVGIGPGDPDQVTVQAIRALERADVLFLVDKGPDQRELVDLRRQIYERHLPHHAPRIVEIPDPARDRDAADYREAVADWRERRAHAWQDAIRDELAPDEAGAFLVWGDPAIYDATITVLERVHELGEVAFTVEVIPGITSVQALAARHRVPLNRVGGDIHITTGRRLREEIGLAQDTVVMLDRHEAFAALPDAQDTEIYWGAYIGTPDELLVAGRVADVAGEIAALRADARRRKGWIMDIYLLRRIPRGPV